MRNLRKRRKLIRQMEQANKIPDKLMPQEIKDYAGRGRLQTRYRKYSK